MRLIKLTAVFFIIIGSFVFSSLSAQQYPGYTLYSVQNTVTTYLMDTASVNYHTWTHATSEKTAYSCYLMPGGILWRTVKNSNVLTGGGMTGRIQKVDWAGTVLWDYVYSSSTYCLHHDICPLANGNVLVISYDVKTSTQVAAAGCNTFTGSVWSEKVMELQPTGATTATVVWQWDLWDHLVQDVDSSKANYQTSIADHPELMNVNYGMEKDWFHMNGIDYNPMLDQIALSSHNRNMWMIIDHSTTTAEAATHAGGNSGKGGDFLYRYGNPGSYNAAGSTVLNVTHDAHFIPEGIPNQGRMVGFNNKGISSTQSSVDQIDLPTNGYNYTITPGSAYSPLTYTQRLACSGYTSNMGSSEQLPNGNMLVCMATAGLIYEVDPAGTTLWSKTATGNVPQAHRYTDCFIDNAAPAIPAISESAGTLTSTPAITYQWYMNGQPIAGDTNQTYTPTQSGIYLVRITDVNGCVYQYSSGFNFVYTATGMNELPVLNDLSLFPNPSTGIVSFDDSDFAAVPYEVLVCNALGKVIIKEKQNNHIDLSVCENGIYFISISLPGKGSIHKKVVLQK